MFFGEGDLIVSETDRISLTRKLNELEKIFTSKIYKDCGHLTFRTGVNISQWMF